MSGKVPYHAYEKRGKMIEERDKRIAELEAENKRLDQYAEKLLCNRLAPCYARNRELEAELEQLKGSLASTHFHHKELVDGCPDCEAALRGIVPELHPDHCLCDDCVTLENMDERLAKSKAFMESQALREDEK